MAGSASSSDAEVFDADAARRQGQAHNVTTASGPAGGIVEDDLSVEDDIVAGVTTTENPADVRMQVIEQYQGSFKGLGNSASGRYHVHLTPEKSAADDMQEDDEGKKKLGRQGTLVNLVEIHGKMSGDGDGWIDEGLEIQEDAHSPYLDEDELEVQATQESHFKRRGALLHRDNSVLLATDHVTFEPSKVTALFETICSQDFEAVRSLVLEDPRIINATGIADFAGMSPMHAAAHFGLDRIAALFLRQPAPCRLTKNKIGREPMHEAVISGSIGVMKTLYDGGCYTVDVFDRFGFTALHYASMLAGVQEMGILRFLVRLCAFDLEAGVQDLAQMASVEDSKLWPADQSETLKNRVESHSRIAKIRSHLVDGDTTLHIAVKAGNESAVKDLVDLGASVRAVNEQGQTPLHCVVALATDHAPGHSFQHIFKILLSNYSVVDAVDNKNNSVLHIAASANAVKVLAYLILHSHVDIHAKNKAGVTPLLIAVQAGHVRCVDLIQGSHPKTLDDVDSRGNSVLHLAAQLDDWRDVVQVLLEFEGADAELKNEQGKTAKDLAVEMDKTELAEMLQNYATVEDKLAMQELESLERRHTFCYRTSKGSAQDDRKLPPLRKDIHHIVRDDDIQNFVKQFAGEDAGTALTHAAVPSPRSLTEVNSITDQVTVVKEFLDRFASRHHFDRFTRWKRKGHGLDPPLSKFTMGYEDMLTLLEGLGLMDQFVSRPEVYKIFWTKAPGQAKATTKEITFSTFRTHMQNFASNTPRELLLKFLSHAEVLQVDSISVSSDRYSSDDDDLDSETRIDGGMRFLGERIDPCDYVPTVTGINSPATSASRGSSRAGVSGLTLSRSIEGRPTTKGSFESSASFASRRSRAQSPDRLSDAFRDFSPTHKDKIRVDLDSGHLQQASWAPGTFFTKNRIRDLKHTGSRLQATPDSSLGRGLRSSSRLSMGE